MRACTRCGAIYATGTLVCPQDGAPTRAAGAPSPPLAPAPAFTAPPAAATSPPPPAIPGPPAWDPQPTLAPAPSGPGDPFLGKSVGNFRLTRRLGSGGMGAVYEAVHPIVGNRVAIKLLGGSFASDQSVVDRFVFEARALNQVANEHIVKVIDLGAHPEGFFYCVMELLEGETLAALLSRGRVEPARALALLVQCLEALAAAHARSIVHRDLKPANIMLVRGESGAFDHVKLVDFGVAKLEAPWRPGATLAGTVIGTPAYMSPEQASGRVDQVDQRSDLYSLGLVAYEMLTGHHPFQGRPLGELIAAQLAETPPPPSRLFDLPPAVDEWVMRLLRKNKQERFPSALAAREEARAVLALLSAPAERRPAPRPAVPSPLAAAPLPPPILPRVDAPAAPRTPPPVTPRPVPETRYPPPPLLTSQTAPGDRVRPLSAAPAPPTPRSTRSPRALFPAPAPAPPIAPTPPLTPARATNPRTAAVRLANRAPPVRRRRPRTLPVFLLALLLAGAIAGAAAAGLFRVGPVVARVATALGIRSPTKSAPVHLVAGDAVQDAWAAAGSLAACHPAFHALVTSSAPTTVAALEPALGRQLREYRELGTCLDQARGELPPASRWAADFLHGAAAITLAKGLEALPAGLRVRARRIEDRQHIRLYAAERFTYEAAAKLAQAKQTAPDRDQPSIDRALAQADLLRERAGTAGR